MRHAIALLLSLVLAAGAQTRLQRRSPDETAAGAANAPGETTYSVEGGAAVLRVGTSDAGTLVVSDPYAVHFAPRRLLGETEYSVELSPGATLLPDGSILLATNVVGSALATNAVTVRSLAGDLAAVDYDALSGPATSVAPRLSGCVWTLTAVTRDAGVFSGRCVVSNLRPYAWTSDRRGAEWDATLERVTLRDTVGAVEMADLRAWVTNRYDPQTAEHWSEHPATKAVRLEGQPLVLDRGRLIEAQAGRIDGGFRLDFSAAGTAVLSVDAPASGATRAIDVIDFSARGTNAVLAVNAALGAEPSVQTRGSLTNGTWTALQGVSSTYPATETVRGTECYVLRFPLDPAADAAFYRAAADIEDPAPRAVRIQDCELYIEGHRYERETWTFTTTNNVTITRSVLVETVP